MILIIIIILFIIYLFLLKPRYVKHQEWLTLCEHDYAHRGLHNDELPENTLPAYANAISHGYGFEFDVQRTKDDVLVIMHDFNLNRACGLDKRIVDLTYEQLSELRVFGSAYKIPLFSEVLELVHGQVPLVIEIKQADRNTRTCELAAAYLDDYTGPFCVESFHPLAVKWFKDHRPNWIRGQLSERYERDNAHSRFTLFMLENLLFNIMTRPDFVAYNVQHFDMFSFMIYRQLLKGNVALWTVRDETTFNLRKRKGTLMIFERFLA